MKHGHKALAALGLAAATATLLAACSTPAEPTEEVQISFLVNQGTISQDLIDRFEEENPGISVTLEEAPPGDPYKQQIRNLTQTGDLPDLFQTPTGPDGRILFDSGSMAEISEFFTTPGYDGETVWAETFTDGVLVAAQAAAPADAYAGGERFWIPITMTGLQVLYNVEQYEELGLEAPATWDEFVENNEAITASGRDALSPGKSDWWIKMAWDQTAAGVTYDDVMSGDVSLGDREFVEAFEAIADLHASGFFPEGTMSLGPEEEQALFLSGNLTQYMTTQNTAAYLAANAPFELGSYTLPALAGETLNTMGGPTDRLVVFEESENKEAAIQLAKFLTSEAVLAERAESQFVLSPLTNKPTVDNVIYENYSASIDTGLVLSMAWFQNFTPEMLSVLNGETYPGAYTGTISPQDAADSIEAQFESVR
jgi:raffinose/stachyose/melibiose transport system substrate-binding protein